MKIRGAVHVNNLLQVRNQIQGANSNNNDDVSTRHDNRASSQVTPKAALSTPPCILDSNQVTFLAFTGGKPLFHLSIKILRAFLFLSHLIALGASVRSFMVWEEVNPHMPRDENGLRIRESDWLRLRVGEIRSSEILYFDVLIASCASYVLVYYIVVGIGISINFGSSVKRIYFLLLMTPVIILLIIFECGIMLLIMDSRQFLKFYLEIEDSNMSFKNALDTRIFCFITYLDNYIDQNGAKMILTYFLCISIQFFTVLLPFFVRDVPFQRNRARRAKMNVQTLEINKAFTDMELKTRKESTNLSASKSAGYEALFNYR